MIIERDALLLAAMVTITAAISIVGLLSLGVAALTAHRRSDTNTPAQVTASVADYCCLAPSGVIAVYGL